MSNQLTFALVGNQNCGKTTLFNQLTGSNQHVGNFPGVTGGTKNPAVLKVLKIQKLWIYRVSIRFLLIQQKRS